MNISKTEQSLINIAGRIFLLIIICCGTLAKAQLNPLSGIYFQNQYLANPAMAGFEKGLNLNLGYRQQWSTMPGAPKTQSFTADYGTGKKVGLGFTVHKDEAGLIKRTRVMGTYSYHLPFADESQKLRFGISLGFLNERGMSENIIGEQNDVSVGKFNQKETYIDGDFGAAYTSKRLTIQAAIPNLKGFLQKEDLNAVANRSSFYSAVRYKFFFPNALDGFGAEPILAIRGIDGFKNIIDAGANFTVANGIASVMSVYHSSQSATIGIGAIIKSLGSINANYTTSTSALREYSSGNFELGLRLTFAKKNIEYID
ncbi:PorP/SprF family type IX secretion system membrane protein [Pedobacter sp. P351]|uniref:PorP/SprF family type IX secretion system membrane protein n=1 Tax=Pedobacter superstes TaxID=3133441 RepID=UPI0030A3EBA4